MNDVAERYVKLVLAIGQHDADYVDAYYGPPEWKQQAESRKVPLADLAAQAKTLLGAIDAVPEPADEMERLRRHYLQRQLSAVAARIRMLTGERLSFDEESRALYDAVAPTLPESHFQKILDQLDKRVPGRWTAARPLREVPQRLRHPAREARCGLSGGHQGMPRAHAAAREAPGV